MNVAHEQTPNYVIDFDSTLITAESLDMFCEIALTNDPNKEATCAKLQEITTLGMSGHMPFDKSLTARLELFSANATHISLLNETLEHKLSPSALTHKEWFEANREHIYVVSGGFEEFIIPAVEHLGILATNVYANAFVYDEKGNIIGHDTTRHAAKAGGKVTQVQALGLTGSVIAIGDGYTDYEIRLHNAANEFWVFTETIARSNVVSVADRVLTSFTEVTQPE